MTRTVSLPTKFLLVVLVGAVLPLGLVGVWLTVSTRRSGEALLAERLNTGLMRAAQEVGAKWVPRRSALLAIGDDSTVSAILARTDDSRTPGIRLPALRSAFADLRSSTQLVLIRDVRGIARWALDADSTGAPILVPAADSLRIRGPSALEGAQLVLPIWRVGHRQPVGSIQAEFRTEAIMPVTLANATAAGGVFGLIDRSRSLAVLPLPFDPNLLQQDRFVWGGEEWLTARRQLTEPDIELLAAAPISAFTVPFQDAAQRGLIALGLVALVGFTVTTVLTRRITRSLVVLAEGADAVAGGDLERKVDVQTGDEVGRLARAFNTMTESLRRTLAELSQRQAVAAVGEFAAALAHEIRNPLSAIRLNLQHVEEKLPNDDSLRAPVAQSLRDIERLETTVAGALRVARTGRMRIERIQLLAPIQAAMRSVQPELNRRRVSLQLTPERDAHIELNANSAALEQLFLNLLFNAAQATEPNGAAGIRVSADAEQVTVTVWDTGAGFDARTLERAFEPFFSTKPEGSGLGLTVARRIVTAHRGSIELVSEPGHGTQVHVRLPRFRATSNGVKPAE